MVALSTIASLLSLHTIYSAATVHFPYEQEHLTVDNINDILIKRLTKQSRIQVTKFIDYLSQFLFSSIDVTDYHKTDVSYDLPGPDNCKIFPGDSSWPSTWSWAGLNLAALGGLIKPAPMSHVCYTNGTDGEDEAACASLAQKWNTARFISDDPIEVMSPHEVGLTCQPSSLLDTEGCTQGGYPSYTVNASSVSQIQLAVNFARNNGIRFVIKNTGHDFLGKSSGAGSLSVWMHGMKDMEYIPSYNSSGWSGPVIKTGAGVQGFELYDFAYQNDVTAMGGLCVTVGVVGGWFQGGGHGPLSPLFGMGADDVLSIDVVTSDGRFVTASETQNADLFWALRGGGAGTYGVITSAIIKAHPEIPASTSTWSFSYPADVSEDVFKKSIHAWLSYFPRYADMGLYSYLNVIPTSDGGGSFVMDPLITPNQTIEEAKAIIQPWLHDIEELGIDFKPDWNYYDSFKGVSDNALTNGSANNYVSVSGNRLFSREDFEGELFESTFDAIWDNIKAGYVVLPYNIAPLYERSSSTNNAVSPAWREAIAYVIMGVTINYTQSAEDVMEARYNFTHGPMQSFRDISPGAGSYGNEGDRLEPNFQWSYFGSFYPRLLELKKRYDPFNVFYAVTAVGSEFLKSAVLTMSLTRMDDFVTRRVPICTKLKVLIGSDRIISEVKTSVTKIYAC